MRQRSALQAVHGYRWYDWRTGAIDRCALAEDATRTDGHRYTEPPECIRDIPDALPGATPLDLATLDAKARRGYVLHDR